MDEEKYMNMKNESPNQTKAAFELTGAILAAPPRVRFIRAVAWTVTMAIVHEGLVNNATAVGASELHGTQRDVADAQRARIGAAAVGAIPVRLCLTMRNHQFQRISINFPISIQFPTVTHTQ